VPLARIAGGAERLLAEVFDNDALDSEALVVDLVFLLVITGLLKSRRAPVRGPCGRFEG
jgi:hypothetical protein